MSHPNLPSPPSPKEGEDSSQVSFCHGFCPDTNSPVPVTCEGACSHLAIFLIQRFKSQAKDMDKSMSFTCWPIVFLTCFLSSLMGISHASPSVRPTGSGSGSSSPAATKNYLFSLQAPTSGKPGKPLNVTVKVLPKGEYHMNLEFPAKLKITGEAANPAKLEMNAKQAAKFTKAELLFKPIFTVGTPGKHSFSGTLRFSICTEKLCEIKTEAVNWFTSITK